MSTINIKQKIESLKKEILNLEKEYYSGNSTTEDNIYDFKLRKLLFLEKQYPEFKTKNSPTKKIGNNFDNTNLKLKHKIPMLSLENAFNLEELNNFFKSINKTKNNLNYFLEPKIDGISISIVYKNNYFYQAISRGDGEKGEDLTEKLKNFKKIPLFINGGPKNFIIRGEIFITKSNFQKINNESKTQNHFSNHRNYVSGTLRLKKIENFEEKKLDVIFYYLIFDDKNLNITKQSQIIEKFKLLNIPTHKDEMVFLSSNQNKVIEFINSFQKIKENSEIPLDGIVVKVDDHEFYEDIGYTSKFPKWAIAYKYPSLIKQTELLDIKISTGRSGKITYLGILKPISINGTLISKATLHNWNNIEKLGLKKGDIVEICKSGEIIPQIIGYSNLQKREDLEKFKIFKNCSSCGSSLIIKNLKIQFCENENCLEKIIAQFTHFASKVAMNIEGLSSQIIKKLYKLNFLKNIEDIFFLKDKKKEILNSNLQIKEKLFNKLILSIENSKNNEQNKVLFALGIDHLGSKNAKILLKKFSSIENILNLNKDELKSVFGIGEKLINSIFLWKQKEKNIFLFQKLKELKILKTISNNFILQDSYIKNKNIVITGIFKISRKKIENFLEQKYSANIQNTITKKTDFLFLGDNPGSKLSKAQKLNIKIIDKKTFYNDFKIV